MPLLFFPPRYVFVLGKTEPVEIGRKKKKGIFPYNLQHIYFHICKFHQKKIARKEMRKKERKKEAVET